MEIIIIISRHFVGIHEVVTAAENGYNIRQPAEIIFRQAMLHEKFHQGRAFRRNIHDNVDIGIFIFYLFQLMQIGPIELVRRINGFFKIIQVQGENAVKLLPREFPVNLYIIPRIIKTAAPGVMIEKRREYFRVSILSSDFTRWRGLLTSLMILPGSMESAFSMASKGSRCSPPCIVWVKSRPMKTCRSSFPILFLA
ncbi:MAG TPA: hypothetical protein PLM53_21295 [Spirochaetota bacterium]|nr:hypothetical protein [Spirochaetota bacterium]